jgi:hypothetical protein
MAGVPWEVGYLGAAAADQAMRRTMSAVLTNPKVAQNLIYAIESGARPAIYGPYVGALIQQNETERSRQQQADAAAKTATQKPANDRTFDAGPMAGKPVPGMLERGNIDLNHRPQVRNDDGSSSTIYSVTVPLNEDGSVWRGDYESAPKYALVPSIVNGRFLTPNGKIPATGDHKAAEQLEDAATEHYEKTREHLGVFDSDRSAETYASKTHAYGADGTDRKVYVPSYGGTK